MGGGGGGRCWGSGEYFTVYLCNIDFEKPGTWSVIQLTERVKQNSTNNLKTCLPLRQVQISFRKLTRHQALRFVGRPFPWPEGRNEK